VAPRAIVGAKGNYWYDLARDLDAPRKACAFAAHRLGAMREVAVEGIAV
jgi:hypothetical protein